MGKKQSLAYWDTEGPIGSSIRVEDIDRFDARGKRRVYGRGDIFDRLTLNMDAGRLLSTREALKEINDRSIETLRDWSKGHSEIFTTPTPEEGSFVAQIFAVEHFQHNIEQKKLLKGGNNADPFIVAKAAVINGTVVTMEQHAPNAAKIPNICNHFDILCLSLEEFMEAEGWKF